MTIFIRLYRVVTFYKLCSLGDCFILPTKHLCMRLLGLLFMCYPFHACKNLTQPFKWPLRHEIYAVVNRVGLNRFISVQKYAASFQKAKDAIAKPITPRACAKNFCELCICGDNVSATAVLEHVPNVGNLDYFISVQARNLTILDFAFTICEKI